MIKVKQIEKIQNFSLLIRFTNQELKWLNVSELNLNNHNPDYLKRLFDSKEFSKVKVGELGQIYWSDVAQMKDEAGNIINCEFDMSPEYVYAFSKKL